MQVASVGGCPQGGVLSPLLWNLTVDELLWDLNEVGYYLIGFTDDTAIIIRDKFPSTVSEVLQNAIKRLENWCNRTKLSVNPNRTTIVSFTRLRMKATVLAESYTFYLLSSRTADSSDVL